MQQLNLPLLDGIDSRAVQVFLTGSYISLALKFDPMPPALPPITYNFPLAIADVRCSLAVGSDAFSVHSSVFGLYAKLLSDTPNSFTPPTAYKVPLTKLGPRLFIASGCIQI